MRLLWFTPPRSRFGHARRSRPTRAATKQVTCPVLTARAQRDFSRLFAARVGSLGCPHAHVLCAHRASHWGSSQGEGSPGLSGQPAALGELRSVCRPGGASFAAFV